MNLHLLKILSASLCFLTSSYAMEIDETPIEDTMHISSMTSQEKTIGRAKTNKKRKREIIDHTVNICEWLPYDMMSIIFNDLPLEDLFRIRLTCHCFKIGTLRTAPDPFKNLYAGYPFGWVLFYPNLKKLEIKDAEYFGHKAIKGLTLWLTKNTNLLELDIERTGKGIHEDSWFVKRPGIGCEGADYLAKGLEKCTSLTSLTLWSCKIGTHGANCLVDILKNSSSLTFLNLGFNNFGDFGARRLAKILTMNLPLKKLILCYNSVGAKGIKALARSLEKNLYLTSLDLQNNGINDEGIKLLSEMLKTNSTLTSLILEDKTITNLGANYMAEMLPINSSLKTLRFRSNKIDDAGVQVLQEALEKNTSLNSLSLDNQGVSYEIRDVMRKDPNNRLIF